MFLRAICLCLWIHGWFISSLCTQDPESADTDWPSVCGPRCVQAILEHYGQHVELVPLIGEMQGGLPEQGCSLRDVQDALERRHIYCLALQTDALSFPEWPNPVIVHYKQDHFAILEETNGVYAKTRDGVDMEPAWQLIPKVMLKQSGALLLTSDSPIQTGRLTFVRWPRFALVFFCGLFACVGVLTYRRFIRPVISRWISLRKGKGGELTVVP